MPGGGGGGGGMPGMNGMRPPGGFNAQPGGQRPPGMGEGGGGGDQKMLPSQGMMGGENGEGVGRNFNQRMTSAHKQHLNDLINPDLLRVTFSIDGVGAEVSGDVKMIFHRSWAPLGVAHLEKMLQAQVYDGVKFFRVVKNFVVQFGIPASPIVSRRWADPIKDDPPFRGIENRRGTIVFATSGANTRTTQLFVNLVENSNSLDNHDFVPIGEVVSGMDILDGIWPDYGERPDQDRIRIEGDEYLKLDYPQMSMVRWARIDNVPTAPKLKGQQFPGKWKKYEDSFKHMGEKLHTKDSSGPAEIERDYISEKAIAVWASKQAAKEHDRKDVDLKKEDEKKKRLKKDVKLQVNVIDAVRRDEAAKKKLRDTRRLGGGFKHQGTSSSFSFFGGMFCSIFVFGIYVHCFKNKDENGRKRKRKASSKKKYQV